MIEKCYRHAKKVIEECTTKHGLFASAGIDGYNAVWARDSMISMIGASKSTDIKFKEVFKQSLLTLEKNQSKNGQIPNAVDRFSKRAPHTDFASIDSSLWFIIGNHEYKKRYKENIIKQSSINKALTWLSYQDTGEKGILEQLPTTDWQDAFPHKYGHVISTQALYYRVLKQENKNKEANRLRFMINNNKDTKLWNNNFYAAYRWKNHNQYQEIGNWFDSLGNLLAIIFNLADNQQANKILNHIENTKINHPYPIKAIFPPIKKASKYWQDYFNDCDAKTPNHYLNGGIWPYLGGFYILSLIKLNKFKKAENELNKLAEANLKGNFPEWIDPNTKKSYGKLQAWDAGMFMIAYKSLKQKKCLL